MEQWKSSDYVYEGVIVRLRVGQAELDDASLALREVVEHPGGVGVIPFTGHSVFFVRQFRIATGEYVLEIPAGKLERDETPEHRGRNELEEEIGYRAGRVVPAGFMYASPGYCSEKIYLFLAFDLIKTRQRLDPDERIEVVEMPLEEVRQRLSRHEFVDGKTVAGLYCLLDYLQSAAS